VAGAGVAEVDFARVLQRYRKPAPLIEPDFDAVTVQLGNGGVLAVCCAPAIVGLTPLQAVTNRDVARETDTTSVAESLRR